MNISVQSKKTSTKYTVFRTLPRLLRFLRISRSIMLPSLQCRTREYQLYTNDGLPSNDANPRYSKICHRLCESRDPISHIVRISTHATQVQACEFQSKLSQRPSVCANVRSSSAHRRPRVRMSEYRVAQCSACATSNMNFRSA